MDVEIDLVADLNAENDEGLGWSTLSDARDACQVRPGATLVAGNRYATACPPGLLTIMGPGVNINRFQHRVPDLAVIRVESFREMFLVDPPALAVEVASPRTRVYDLGRKKEVYERFGIRSYWIIDVGQDKPSLTVLELRRASTPRLQGLWGTKSSARSIPSRSRSCPPGSCDAAPTRSLGTTRPVCPGGYLAVLRAARG